MTIPVGESVSNPINLGTERLVGIWIIEDSSAERIAFQAMVAGDEEEPTGQVWTTIRLTDTEIVPGTGYLARNFMIDAAAVLDNMLLLFPRDKTAYVPPVIRLINLDETSGAPENIVGTPFVARLITDSHS